MAMGTSIDAFIQIDDNSPPDAPFTNDPSTWDLRPDIGLCGCKDYAFYAAISGVRNQTGVTPLFPLRGLPPTNSDTDPILDLTDSSAKSWLTLSELQQALEHMSVPYSALSEHVLAVLECMATLERIYGKDRVRLVFAIE
jgi:hypothetical protein